jgi:hypothetical protein
VIGDQFASQRTSHGEQRLFLLARCVLGAAFDVGKVELVFLQPRLVGGEANGSAGTISCCMPW